MLCNLDFILSNRFPVTMNHSIVDQHPIKNLENMVIQYRYVREYECTETESKELLHNIYNVFETAILNVMYEWTPGQSMECIDQIADFIICVRDVNGRFGERDVAYILLWCWYRFFPDWALRIFRRFVGGVGCWSDVKYMCKMLRDFSKSDNTDIILKKETDHFRDDILDIMLQQLLDDHVKWEMAMDAYFENRRQFFDIDENQNGWLQETNRFGCLRPRIVEGNRGRGWKNLDKRPREPLVPRPCARKILTMAAKWCPREKSKYGWLFSLLVLLFRKISGSQQHNNNKGNKFYKTMESRSFRQMVSQLSKEVTYDKFGQTF